MDVRPERLVQYSLTLADDRRPDLIWQFGASVRTLRAHNRAIAVVLFVYGAVTVELAALCRELGVAVYAQGPYEHRLAALCPQGWPALARYPLLHKLLNFRALAGLDPRQVLCCDCDTVFFDDVEILFDRYRGPDVVAREEVHSSRSHYGVDRNFIDEHLLAQLAEHVHAAKVAPFNLGVVLLNNRVWRSLGGLDHVLVDYAWRFVTWMGRHPATGPAAQYGEFLGAAEARALAGPADLARALPYPSVNRWILDEVATWLAVGHVPGVRLADFHRGDVAQNGEFAGTDPRSAPWIVCHYYSQNMRRIDAWLKEPIPTAA